ncbi:MAG TPA: DNA recombination protein RmuC [Steroidobacteraceae bacterium]|nr:DNA recombination protein RmuC [Steroidobacteraceae bacterium]
MNSALLIVVAALAAGLIGYLLATLRAARRAESLRAELADARARIASDEQQRARTAELLAHSEAQVRAAIEGASRVALDANSETFLKLAREVFGRDQAAAQATLKEREVAIAQLLEPIKESLRKQEEQAQNIVREHRESAGKIAGQIENLVNVQALLQRETRNLSTALRRPEVRGRWGEITLRRVVELAGLSEHCDFDEQTQVLTGERNLLRPDLLVRMPESRTIVIDAKTPLDAFMDAAEATDEEARRAALTRHAMQVEQRVRELGQKSYWEQFEHSPEFAVLFLPGDQFLSAALAENSELIETALKQRIIVTTPSTLMALLKVIAYGWRQNLVTENAREIRKLGEDLHKRLNVFVTHLQKVSRSLGSAVDSFNASVGSMERNVLPQARKFTELGVAGEALPSVDPVEQLVRLPASETKPDENRDETPN